jgi:hypothetical protein
MSSDARPETLRKLLEAAGVGVPAEKADYFVSKIVEIERDKPADSAVVVALHEGAVIFMPKRLAWTVSRVWAALLVLSSPFYAVIFTLFAFFKTAEAAQAGLGTGAWGRLVIFTVVLIAAGAWSYYAFARVRSGMISVLGRWQLIAAPETIVVRHSFMGFATMAVVDPRFVVVGAPASKTLPPSRGVDEGDDTFAETVGGLGDRDALWLGRTLRALYPSMSQLAK